MKIFLEVVKYTLICYNILIVLGILLSIKDKREDKSFNLLIFIFSCITIAYLFMK